MTNPAISLAVITGGVVLSIIIVAVLVHLFKRRKE